MSVTGIASSLLSILSGSRHQQSPIQQIRSEFQQLGQDLQSGNLTQAQSDFTTLSKNLSSVFQNSGITSATTPTTTAALASTAATTAPANTNPVIQAFNQLGQDLQSGNLQAAQQDFTTIQQDAQQQQNAAQVQGHHHHHHHAERSENSSSSSSSQQTNPVLQAFNQLAQSLQSGNLQSAQQAFSTLQTDLQQIGGFTTQSGGATSAAPPAASSLNVTV
jgi:outer membrane protein assembly factor BamD (BamD/ComL family)